MNPRHASQEYLATRVEGTDPLGRVVMLHQGVVRFIREAIACIERRDLAGAHEALVKAKQIVLHFLASIPESDDTDLAANLRGLFKYAYQMLLEGNLRKDPDCAEAALQIVTTLGEGWAELEKHNKSTARNRPGGMGLVG